MQSRSNTLPEPQSSQHSAWLISSAIHLGIALLLALVFFPLWPGEKAKKVDFEVYEMPKVASQAVSLLQKPREKPKAEEKKRAVFGASRKSLTSEEGIDVKAGNTVAKAPDQEKLRPEDEDSLPIPVDEYLVSQMPLLENDVRIPYPPAARQARVEGPVVMDLLIDGSGKVREAKLVEGPGHGLNEAAVEAAKNFKFKPARVEDKTVAVRIRYVYRFVLER